MIHLITSMGQRHGFGLNIIWIKGNEKGFSICIPLLPVKKTHSYMRKREEWHQYTITFYTVMAGGWKELP